MASKLFVGGLSWGTTEDALRNHFAQVGTVVSATVITDKYTGKSKGFGFVEMSSEEEAQQAKDQFNGQEFDGRTITVSEARPQQPRENRFGGGRGGNRGGDRYQGGNDRGFGGDMDNDRGFGE
ncbi:MAG: RNA recognition motif containing protein [Microgenomates bacterium OLB23]|nr:MAG: RNA recognition motif containing protein [Microgenomates bacterium OLB23]